MVKWAPIYRCHELFLKQPFYLHYLSFITLFYSKNVYIYTVEGWKRNIILSTLVLFYSRSIKIRSKKNTHTRKKNQTNKHKKTNKHRKKQQQTTFGLTILNMIKGTWRHFWYIFLISEIKFMRHYQSTKTIVPFLMIWNISRLFVYSETRYFAYNSWHLHQLANEYWWHTGWIVYINTWLL